MNVIKNLEATSEKKDCEKKLTDTDSDYAYPSFRTTLSLLITIPPW